MTIRTRLTALERAAAASMPGDVQEITLEEFKALPCETKLAYLRGQIRFALPPPPPEEQFHGGTIEEYRAHMYRLVGASDQ